MIKLEQIQEHLEDKYYLDMATSDMRFAYVVFTYTRANKNGLTTLQLMHNAHFSYCSEEEMALAFSAFQRSAYRSAEKINEVDDFIGMCDVIIKEMEE